MKVNGFLLVTSRFPMESHIIMAKISKISEFKPLYLKNLSVSLHHRLKRFRFLFIHLLSRTFWFVYSGMQFIGWPNIEMKLTFFLISFDILSYLHNQTSNEFSNYTFTYNCWSRTFNEFSSSSYFFITNSKLFENISIQRQKCENESLGRKVRLVVDKLVALSNRLNDTCRFSERDTLISTNL